VAFESEYSVERESVFSLQKERKKMAKQKNLHGIAGLILLLISQALLLKNVEPVASWFYYCAWWPYILIADSIIYKIKKNSLLMNRRVEFFLMLLWSVVIWTFFESVNLIMQNWYYINVVPFLSIRWIGYAVAYATVLPGIFETTELLEAAGLFKTNRVKPLGVNQGWLTGLFILGIICLLGVLLSPRYCFPLIWCSLIFFLDPINYLKGGKSLLKDWEQGTARKFYLLLTAGLICGILWEFWNFWSRTKWIYTVPFFEELKLFEMPLAGFLGFPPFAVECYVMYNFISLFRHHRGWEEDNYRLNRGKRVSSPVKVLSFLVGLMLCLSTFYTMDSRTVNSYWPRLEELQKISPEMIARLASQGIDTPQELIRKAGTEKERGTLAQELDIAVRELEEWKKMAELAELKGMGTLHANLLVQAGIEDIPSLAKQNSATLYPVLIKLYQGKTISPPREAIIRIWVRAAETTIRNN
jgi:hypothetical protein